MIDSNHLGGVSETTSETLHSWIFGAVNMIARSATGVRNVRALVHPGRKWVPMASRNDTKSPRIVSGTGLSGWPTLRSLSRELDGACLGECAGEPGEDAEVGVKLDAIQATDDERCEAVFVLEPAELALDSGAAAVEVAESLCLARDERVASVGLDPAGLRGAFAGGARHFVALRV
jgi:hypothetical protein